GPPGRDAKQLSLGSVTTGDEASATLNEVDGVQVLTLVLPRGERGADSNSVGPRGEAGANGMGEEEILNLIVKTIDDPSLLDRATVKLAYVEHWVAEVLRRTQDPHTLRILEGLRQHLRK